MNKQKITLTNIDLILIRDLALKFILNTPKPKDLDDSEFITLAYIDAATSYIQVISSQYNIEFIPKTNYTGSVDEL